jgi:peptidylprolyl isomerase
LNTSTNNVLLETNMGNITIQLFDDMPITTGNFENLVRTGVYDGQTSLALLQVL